jgi:hypothetical protein
MATWYCAIEDRQSGPFSSDQLRNLAERGLLRPQDRVRRADSEQWVPAAKVRGLFPDEPKTQPKSGPPPIAQSPQPPVPPTTPLPTAIPLHPVTAVPVASVPSSPSAALVVISDPESPAKREPRWNKRHASKRKTKLVVGGLSAALLVLVTAALFLLGRSPTGRDDVGDLAETDPRSPAPLDPETDPLTVAASDARVGQRPEAGIQKPLPKVARWLNAGTQKRGVGDRMRLHVPAVWWAGDPETSPTLVVEVEITNISATQPLEYSGWTGDLATGQGEAALLLVASDEHPIPASSSRDSADGSSDPQRLAPQQRAVRRLHFRLTQTPGNEYCHLILPYAAWGLPGYVGFEIPIETIQKTPPEVVMDATSETTTTESSVQSLSERPAGGSVGEPETIDDLRMQIEAAFEASEPDQAAESPPDTPSDEVPAEPDVDPSPDPT